MGLHRLSSVFPAGIWLAAASVLVRVTRIARAYRLISAASALILIRWIGALHRAGFGTWRHNGRKWRWSAAPVFTARR